MDWACSCWKNRNHPISHASENFTFYIPGSGWVIFKALCIYFWAIYYITMTVYCLWIFCDLRSKENYDPFVITSKEAKKTVQ